VHALTLLSIVGTSQDCKKSLIKKIGNKPFFHRGVCTNLEGLLQYWDLCTFDKKSFLGRPSFAGS
jgi:hypothetical protein